MLSNMLDNKLSKEEEITEQQIVDLLEAMFKKTGYDFRDYSRAHIKRRIQHRLALSNFESIDEMTKRVEVDEILVKEILQDLSINVTEMFRDPDLYHVLRKEVIPFLKTYPYFKIWHAGCASGEEVYSMAILLKEEGILERARIYATDFSPKAVARAKEGIYSNNQIKLHTKNYILAGCNNDFSDYYHSKYDSVIISPELKKNIVFAEHNLVTDSVFNEMNLIVCRNVMIYFNRNLQNRVVGLFKESLADMGMLVIGNKENIRFIDNGKYFETIDDRQKIYRRVV
jgi:chemotaxis protein methyltransferase CheR